MEKNTETHQDEHGDGKWKELHKTSTTAMKWRDKQTNVIPFLFCYLISFHYIYIYIYIYIHSVCTSVFILDYITISRSFSIFSYVVTHGTKFLKSSPHKIVFSKRITAALTFKRIKTSEKKIQHPSHGVSLGYSN